MYLCYKGEMDSNGFLPISKGIIFESPEKAFEWAYDKSKDWTHPANKKDLPIKPGTMFSCYDVPAGEYSKICFIEYIKIEEEFEIHYLECNLTDKITAPIIEHIDKVFRELKGKPTQAPDFRIDVQKAIHNSVIQSEKENQRTDRISKMVNDRVKLEAKRQAHHDKINKEVEKAAIETGKKFEIGNVEINIDTDYHDKVMGVRAYALKDFPRVQLKKDTGIFNP